MKVLRAFVIAVAVAALVSARAQLALGDSTASTLLAKHRAYVGWQFGDGSFRSVRIEGSAVDASGQQTEKILTLFRGLVYQTTYTMVERGNITERNGFTGNLFWQSDRNGFTTPIYGGYAKYLASLTVLQQEGTAELPAAFVRSTAIGGKAVDVVRVTLVNGDPIDCYVDPQTGAYLRATIDPGGAYEKTIDIISYADIAAGKRMISSYRFGGDRTLYTYDRIEPNAAISDEALHPPASTARWSFRRPDAVGVTLTKNRILIDATVNGVAGKFILDTGATAIVFDDQFADRAHLEPIGGTGEAGTFYGRVTVRTRRVDTIDFGSAALHNVLVDSEDFRAHDYRGLDRQSLDGLIGYDLFAAAIVKLDVYDSKITILDPSADLAGAQGLALLVDLSRRIPAIPVTINKTLAVDALLDTGNPAIAFLSFDLARAHDVRIGSPVCGNLQSLTIGSITYLGQSVCLDNFGADMLLGYDFLKHFNFVFDYPQGRMFMMPNKN